MNTWEITLPKTLWDLWKAYWKILENSAIWERIMRDIPHTKRISLPSPKSVLQMFFECNKMVTRKSRGKEWQMRNVSKCLSEAKENRVFTLMKAFVPHPDSIMFQSLGAWTMWNDVTSSYLEFLCRFWKIVRFLSSRAHNDEITIEKWALEDLKQT